jgi:hypothetical protein
MSENNHGQRLRFVSTKTGRVCCDTTSPDTLCDACLMRYKAGEGRDVPSPAPFPPHVPAPVQPTGVPPPPSFAAAIGTQPSREPATTVLTQANGVPAAPKFAEVMKGKKWSER